MAGTVLPSITERANPITADIDVQTPQGIVELLHKSDGQLFLDECVVDGEAYPGMFHPTVLRAIEDTAQCISAIIQREPRYRGTVVFSGCGTSGRLAFYAARIGNLLLKSLQLPERFTYLIAGGDKALVTAQELQEDMPGRGIKDLVALEERLGLERGACDQRPLVGVSGDDPQADVVYIGITCGLSAPYVAGQLHYGLQSGRNGRPGPQYATAIIGFNPLALANETVLPGYEVANSIFNSRSEAHQSPTPGGGPIARSVKEVLIKMVEPTAATSLTPGHGHVQSHAVVPVVGAEPIAGSTRMKGGSGTKMILEALILRAAGLAIAKAPTLVQAHAPSPGLRAAEQAGEGERVEIQGSESQPRPSHASGAPPPKQDHNIAWIDAYLRAYQRAHAAFLGQHSLPPPLTPGDDRSTHPHTPPAASLPATRPFVVALAQLVSLAGQSLKAGGHVYYLGASDDGILGFVDASEQVPTFGAKATDVRGFIAGGYDAMQPREKELLQTESESDERYQASIGDFLTTVVPTLTSDDVVIALHCPYGVVRASTGIHPPTDQSVEDSKEVAEAAFRAQRAGARIALIIASDETSPPTGPFSNVPADLVLNLFPPREVAAQCPTSMLPIPSAVDMDHLPSMDHRIASAPGTGTTTVTHDMSSASPILGAFAARSVGSLVVKWVLNAVTTGAHVLKGKVYTNRMIDLRLSNKKLFRRAVNLVSMLGLVAQDEATSLVIQAIHRPDLTDDLHVTAHPTLQQLQALNVTDHIIAAVRRPLVIPIALLMALSRSQGQSAHPLDSHQAEAQLLQEPVVRTVILKAMQSPSAGV